jgi:LytS/YehU family sensor histidine kinase
MQSIQNNAAVERFQERTLYALWALFWILMTVVEMQDNWYATGVRWWEPFLWIGSSAGVGTIWFVLQRHLDRRIAFDAAHPGHWFVAHLKWLPIVAATMIIGMYGIRHAVYGALGMRYHHGSWSFVALYESIKLSLFFGLWLGIFFALNSFRALQGERQRLLLMEKSVNEARLAQLKSQLQPHFFFNVLNTISALMHVDVERADRLVARMGDFLRATLRSDQERWPLADELRLLALYADIMLERFADRVTLSWTIDPASERALVPVLVLQPLMENAFRHGVERTSETVAIEVSAITEHQMLCVEIRNSGELVGTSGGIGVLNVRERLDVMYGTQAQFALDQDPDGVRAKIRIPLQPA